MPRKNLRLLAGKPLIQYTIEAAQRSALLGPLVVSTEDEEIARVSKSLGVDVVDRPPALAGDEVPMWPVVHHALEFVERRSARADAWYTGVVRNDFSIAAPTTSTRTTAMVHLRRRRIRK